MQSQRHRRLTGASRRTMAGALLLVMAFGAAGMLLGESRARADAIESADQAIQAVRSTIGRLPSAQAELAIVSVDDASNLVCVEASVGQSGGISCNALDAPEPWYTIAGGDSAGPATLTVVDGQRRLGSIVAIVNGQRIEAASQDGGLSISGLLDAPPSEITVLDGVGNVLAVHDPLAQVVTGEANAAAVPTDPEGDHGE